MWCPICGNKESKKFLSKVCLTSKEEYDLVECYSCESRYFSPMPEIDEIVSFYEGVFWGEDEVKQIGKGAAFARLYLSSSQSLNEKPKFLDVGCASGFFLKGVQEQSNWDCHGIEINPELATHARDKLALKIHTGTLDNAPFDKGSFDYIHLRDIVEHVTQPLEFLLSCRQFLKPDGRVYLSIPNGYIDSIGLIEFYQNHKVKARSPNGHLYFFNKSSLELLLSKAGFGIASSGTYGIKYGLRALGYLPRKSTWSKSYDSRELWGNSEGFIAVKRTNTPLSYHIWKMFWHRWLMYRGLLKVGLDFELILKPINT